MELSKICEKIITDADSEASKIVEEANRKSIELINSASQNNKKKAMELESTAPSVAKEIYEKLVSDANIKAKKEILAAKRELLDEVFKKALLNLYALKPIKRRL